MATKTKSAQLKLLGIWLPPDERWEIKTAAAARHMTLNQAVRQALREWIARSNATSAPPQASAPQPAAKPGREPAPENVAALLRQARAAASATGSPDRPQPAAKPAGRTQAQASGTSRKSEPEQRVAAPSGAGPPFAWLRGAAGLDWSGCAAVEGRPAPDGSRVWVFRGTQVTLKKVFRLLQEGHRSAKVGRRFQLDPQLFEEVLRFAAQRLAPSLPGAR